MPAYRRKNMCCAYREETPIPKKPRAPRKKLTEEEKAEAELLRLKRKAKKEAKTAWEETLKPWIPVEGFRWRPGTLAMYKSDAKAAYGLTDKDMMTLKYESISGSSKTFFRHADVKALSIRKFEASANSDKIELPGQAIGQVRTFSKTDYNINRRARTNWIDHESCGSRMLEIREQMEIEKLAEYAKKSTQNKK